MNRQLQITMPDNERVAQLMSEQSLRDQIEQKRNQLVKTANKYGISSEKTLRVSQELDQLLNTYEQPRYKRAVR